ncbi:unnamed protein product [Microthlaspi erraticum]|uniref:Integrase catalytic domain-containing protein n=1 Tax=Microthlaspi erraticum TaxID=1685480 RepID=A0A6D2LA21_9BRAS|nr:unnamed protein product [Microthlaspi erraticum]
MTGDRDFLVEQRSVLPCSVGLPNGKQSLSRETGTVVFDEDFKLINMLFVPDLKCNLISVSQLIEDLDVVMQIANKGCVVQDRTTRNLSGVGELRDGLYFFRRLTEFNAFRLNKDEAEDVWHQRLGHPSNGVFDLLPVVGSRVKDFSTCSTCFKAKQCRDMFLSSNNKSDGVFEMIHLDLWGPYRIASLCNSYYFLTIVDDYSRAVWVYLLHSKAQVGQLLRQFLAMVDRQFSKKVKVVRSDNGTEFTCLSNEFREAGILHQTSCVGTPQQNGRVERKHRHILNVARAILFQSSLPTKFWGESILTAAHLINRTPSKLLKGKTPFELLHEKPPEYDNLKVFGCLAFAHKKKRSGDKFEAQSRKCVFVGYPFGKKGWNLFDLKTEEIFASRDVVFVENTFPFADISCENQRDDWRAMGELDEAVEEEELPRLPEILPTAVSSSPAVSEELIEKEADTAAVAVDVVDVSTDNVGSVGMSDVAVAKVADTANDVEELGRGCREKKVSTRLKDFVLNTVVDPDDPTEITVEFEDEVDVEYPLSHYLDSSKFSPSHRAFLAAITAETEPTLFRDAVVYEVWRGAMKVEIKALDENHTWDLVKLPAGKRAIGCKWVYKIKYRSDGSIERYKARLVVLGNRQEEGVDFK